MNTEDITLVGRAKQYPQEFEKLYTKYADKVFNYFWYRTGHDKMLSEDLMQETFLRAFRHVGRFNNRGYAYLTYLITIARNVLIDYFRKEKPVLVDSFESVPSEITEDAEKKEEKEALWRAVQSLSESHKDVLLMKYQQGMSIKDIARVRGVSENAVKLLLSRARKKLKTHLNITEMSSFADKAWTQTRARFLTHKMR